MKQLNLKPQTIKMAEYDLLGGGIGQATEINYVGQVSPNRPRPNNFKRTVTGTAIPQRKTNRVEINIDFDKVAQMEAELAAGTLYTYDWE